ncbi:MAG: hypothetical protein AB8B60_01830 [Sulfitobacter sp.]
MAQGPVFLERQSYRFRRLLDAVRLLPLLGVLLWMVPLLWPLPTPDDAGTVQAMPMSVALLYLFGVWVLMVVVGWLLWRRTARRLAENAQAHADDLG